MKTLRIKTMIYFYEILVKNILKQIPRLKKKLFKTIIIIIWTFDFIWRGQEKRGQHLFHIETNFFFFIRRIRQNLVKKKCAKCYRKGFRYRYSLHIYAIFKLSKLNICPTIMSRTIFKIRPRNTIAKSLHIPKGPIYSTFTLDFL